MTATPYRPKPHTLRATVTDAAGRVLHAVTGRSETTTRGRAVRVALNAAGGTTLPEGVTVTVAPL